VDAKRMTFRTAVLLIGLGTAFSAVPVLAATHVVAGNTSSQSPIIKTINAVGYAAGPEYHSAKVTFKVPTITCPSVDAAYVPGAFADGPDGGFGEAAVVTWCHNGQLLYYAQTVINNGAPSELFTVAPGDSVTASISETVGGTLITVTDHTSGATQTVTGPGGGVTSAWVGAWAGNDGSQIDVPAFKPDSFTGASIGGKPLGSVNPVEMEMVSGSVVRVEPGAITSGNAFNMLFKHN
jgi:hypothetical protein